MVPTISLQAISTHTIIRLRTIKTFLITPLLFILIIEVAGQNKKIKFSSVNQFGLLSGSSGESWMLQTINGIKKDKWFAGAGAGLDFYNERTVPLFLDLRKELSNKINTPFIYADAGLNFPWLNSIQRQQKQFPKTSPGLFYDLGIGWKLSGKNNRGFLVSAGYSFKQVKEKVKSVWWPAPTPQLEFENYERYNYLYRRVVIKVGFML
jgi:hypothetical protein